MKSVLKLILGANVVFALLSLLAYLSPFVDPQKTWLLSAIAIFNPWYIVIHLGFSVFWLLAKRKYALLSIAILLIGFNHIRNIYGFNVSGKSEEGIEIVNYNLQNSSFLKDDENGQKAEQYKQFLREFGSADVFCAYEMSYQSKQVVKNELQLKYEASYEHKSLGIYSRYPVLDKGLIDYGNRSNNCLWADLLIEEDTIRIYAVHFESSQLSVDAQKVMDSGDIQDGETWKSVRQIFSKYGHHAINRIHQLQALLDHKATSPHPVIVCGDFNETPQSHLYFKLSKGMVDSFRKKGRGIGSTYAGPIHGLRIDYILADENFVIEDHEVVRELYSDHFPIISRLRLK